MKALLPWLSTAVLAALFLLWGGNDTKSREQIRHEQNAEAERQYNEKRTQAESVIRRTNPELRGREREEAIFGEMLNPTNTKQSPAFQAIEPIRPESE